MPRVMAPPDSESKLALRAHAHALVPKTDIKKTCMNVKVNVLQISDSSLLHQIFFRSILFILTLINDFIMKTKLC